MIARRALSLLLVATSAAVAAPPATGPRLSGGGTGDVYLLEAHGKKGVVKVPLANGPRFLRPLEEQLADYRIAAREYQGPALWADTMIEVRLPDGRVTQGIFMERIEGLSLDQALKIFHGTRNPQDGRRALERAAGFAVGPEHLEALQRLEARLRKNGHALHDVNAENLFLVAPERGHLRLIDPSIDEVPDGPAGERERKRALESVRSDLSVLAAPGPMPAAWNCALPFSALR